MARPREHAVTSLNARRGAEMDQAAHFFVKVIWKHGSCIHLSDGSHWHTIDRENDIVARWNTGQQISIINSVDADTPTRLMNLDTHRLDVVSVIKQLEKD